MRSSFHPKMCAVAVMVAACTMLFSGNLSAQCGCQSCDAGYVGDGAPCGMGGLLSRLGCLKSKHGADCGCNTCDQGYGAAYAPAYAPACGVDCGGCDACGSQARGLLTRTRMWSKPCYDDCGDCGSCDSGYRGGHLANWLQRPRMEAGPATGMNLFSRGSACDTCYDDACNGCGGGLRARLAARPAADCNDCYDQGCDSCDTVGVRGRLGLFSGRGCNDCGETYCNGGCCDGPRGILNEGSGLGGYRVAGGYGAGGYAAGGFGTGSYGTGSYGRGGYQAGACATGNCGPGYGHGLGGRIGGRLGGGYGCGRGGCGIGGRLCGACGGGLAGEIPRVEQPAYPGFGGVAPTYAYPYYTTRGPRDFLTDNPPSIGW